MNVLIFGATGMVGIEALHACLEDDRVNSVTCVVRRSTGEAHRKLTEITHTDYSDYAALQDAVAACDLCIHCIGVYQGTVPTDEFLKITCDYFAALVRQIEETKPAMTFCLFSAQGADPTGRSRVLFARAKGKAEKTLTDSSIQSTFIFRPGYINPGRRQAKSRIPVWLARPFFKLLPFVGVEASDLARLMVRVGIEGNTQKLFENRDIRRLSKP
jgi:uncharacterized protein YbjT (DUF2867 family)